jgi:hypothetical protein
MILSNDKKIPYIETSDAINFILDNNQETISSTNENYKRVKKILDCKKPNIVRLKNILYNYELTKDLIKSIK